MKTLVSGETGLYHSPWKWKFPAGEKFGLVEYDVSGHQRSQRKGSRKWEMAWVPTFNHDFWRIANKEEWICFNWIELQCSIFYLALDGNNPTLCTRNLESSTYLRENTGLCDCVTLEILLASLRLTLQSQMEKTDLAMLYSQSWGKDEITEWRQSGKL